MTGLGWADQLDALFVQSPPKQILVKLTLLSVDQEALSELGFELDSPRIQFPLTLGDSSIFKLELNALETVGRASVIASPRLRLSDGARAQIESGLELPYFEYSENGGQKVQYKKAIVGMKVRAKNLGQNRIGLELDVRQDQPGEWVQNTPSFKTQSMKTKTEVLAGHTVVLAGLYLEHTQNGERRIPVLSGIPVVGHLFTVRKIHRQKRQILVLVTPSFVEQGMSLG